MYGTIKSELQKELEEIKDSGLYKTERIIDSPQGGVQKRDSDLRASESQMELRE